MTTGGRSSVVLSLGLTLGPLLGSDDHSKRKMTQLIHINVRQAKPGGSRLLYGWSSCAEM